MRKLITEFTKQLKLAVEIAGKAKLNPVSDEIRNVVVSGMGGSGITGNMISDLILSESAIPVTVNKNYFLPNFVNNSTLVIISSYSGDTEETVNSFREALSRKAKIVCITSGGLILNVAKENSVDYILLPSGLPPRAALGFSFVQLMQVLHVHHIIADGYKNNLQAAIELLDKEEMNMCRDAKETATLVQDKLIVAYGTAGMESVALRFSQQLNENSKLLCLHNVFPELNHNELQGWTKNDREMALILFRNESDYGRTAKRIDITKGIISYYVRDIKEVYSKGDSPLERMLYLVHWGDWVSYFLGEMKGIDTKEVPIIHYLKSELAKPESLSS